MKISETHKLRRVGDRVVWHIPYGKEVHSAKYRQQEQRRPCCPISLLCTQNCTAKSNPFTKVYSLCNLVQIEKVLLSRDLGWVV